MFPKKILITGAEGFIAKNLVTILNKKGLTVFGIETKKFSKRPAIFLDRDGTINYDKGYTYKFSEFKFRPYVIKGLKYLTKKKIFNFHNN